MILIAAATPWEAGPLAKRWGLEPVAGAKAWGGKVGGKLVRVLETGMGREKAAAALESLDDLKWPAPDLVVSAGFAGALQDGLRGADLVADLRGMHVEWVQLARSVATSLGVPLHLGAFHSSERVLSPDEKRAVGVEHRAVAVDLETAALRSWSEARSTAFGAVRAVFDLVDERAPSVGPEDASFGATVRFLAAHWTQAPGLASWWPRQSKGMKRLGRFLEKWLGTL
ncbi:MAG: hypothetical protein HY553_06525 [Elusimicrobia bacterium]|nr:hypothetical protein [Elusimicrobiota bacterium]